MNIETDTSVSSLIHCLAWHGESSSTLGPGVQLVH